MITISSWIKTIELQKFCTAYRLLHSCFLQYFLLVQPKQPLQMNIIFEHIEVFHSEVKIPYHDYFAVLRLRL